MGKANDSGQRAPHYAAALREASDEQILRDCRWEAFRASGPGGQKRNKTSSAIRVVHEPTGIAAIANESRSQSENKKKALRRLRHRMTLELRDTVESQPPWFEALRSDGRLDVPRRGAMYLPAMGLVLDVLAAGGWSVSQAARLLGISTGNLVRFLQSDKKLLAHVNQNRAAVGLKALG